MREQVASPVFSPPIERKKASIKIPRRDENNDSRRRLGGGCLSYLGGKPVVNMPGDRLRGGSSILQSREQELESRLPESGVEKMKEDAKREMENERLKRRPSEDDDLVLLQWGHRKRSRCSRIDLKHVTDESSILSKKTIRVVDRRVVVKPEKQLAVAQTIESKGQTLRPCVLPTAVLESASESARRNGHDFRLSFPTSNSCPPAEMRNCNGNAAERADRHFPSSPENQDTVSTRPLSTPEGGSPEAAAAMPTAQNGNEAAHPIPQAVERVDLDLFEWPKIFISLSRKEKEDDFMTIKGTKLPQRPKRRPKVVEKALHYCSPGNWLSDLARGRYDVREKKSVKKKPRGLKAMESMDSDSE